jgi:hypothetical protein
VRYLTAITAAVLLASCAEHCEFEMYPDDETYAIFMGEQPTCEELAMWLHVHDAATRAWGSEPESIFVWFLRSDDQHVYYDGRTHSFPLTTPGACWWGGGERPSIFLAAWYDPYIIQDTMCHELTHVYWRLLDHDSRFFLARKAELVAEVWTTADRL